MLRFFVASPYPCGCFPRLWVKEKADRLIGLNRQLLAPNTIYRNTNFTHKYQSAFFKTFGRKTEEHCGVTRYSIYDNIAERVQVTELTD